MEIDYWQYTFETSVRAMDQLIAKFQQANPGITVKQTNFPYADYQTKVSAAVVAGNGPDMVQLFYGWLAGELLAAALAKGIDAGGAAVGRIGGAPMLSDRKSRET